MASGRWADSTRRDTLPPDWPRIRRRVLARDHHQCRIRTPSICTDHATDIDHTAGPGDHRDEALRAACGPCHRDRSAQQGGHASTTARRHRAAARTRAGEPHPGIIGGTP